MASLDALKAEMTAKAEAALTSERNGDDQWRENWVDALIAAEEYFLAFEREAMDPKEDHQWPPPLPSLLGQTALMLREETGGIEQHFWSPMPHGTTKTQREWQERIFIICVTKACSEMKRRKRLSRPRNELARTELRRFGIELNVSEIHSMMSNVSHLPHEVREAVSSWESVIETDIDPRWVMDMMKTVVLDADKPFVLRSSFGAKEPS